MTHMTGTHTMHVLVHTNTTRHTSRSYAIYFGKASYFVSSTGRVDIAPRRYPSQQPPTLRTKLEDSHKIVSPVKFPISGGIDPDSCTINIEALKQEQAINTCMLSKQWSEATQTNGYNQPLDTMQRTAVSAKIRSVEKHARISV